MRWIAEMLGYPDDCGGLLTSGGNMANFFGFLAARAREGARGTCGSTASAGSGARRLASTRRRDAHLGPQGGRPLRPGHGRDSLAGDRRAQRMDVDRPRAAVREDRRRGGCRSSSSATRRARSAPARSIRCPRSGRGLPRGGALVPRRRGVRRLRRGCRAPADLRGLALADSVAVDPHKWLYVPLEAGCALVRDRGAAARRSSIGRPTTTAEEEEDVIDYYQLRPAELARLPRAESLAGSARGRPQGYRRMIARRHRAGAAPLRRGAQRTPGARGIHGRASITTFRYGPAGLRARSRAATRPISTLNAALARAARRRAGRSTSSNAVVEGRFLLRRAS